MKAWMRAPWAPAHWVVDGRAVCGTDLPLDTSPAAPAAARCGTCEVRKAKRERRVIETRNRRARQREQAAALAELEASRPAVFAGVDPLIDVIHRYERGEL